MVLETEAKVQRRDSPSHRWVVRRGWPAQWPWWQEQSWLPPCRGLAGGCNGSWHSTSPGVHPVPSLLTQSELPQEASSSAILWPGTEGRPQASC